MKMLKSKKALSPVVASIILVAVTVAVSLAVAIWMGALTGGFMSSGEKIKVGTPYGWTDKSVTVYVINDGGTTVKIIAAKVQGGPSGTNYVDEYIDVSDVEIAPKAGENL
jgi:flagellin-like protein